MRKFCLTMAFILVSACSSGSGVPDSGLDADASFDAADAAGDVSDGVADSGGDLGGVGPCRFDPKVEWFALGEVLQMQSQDGLTCLWLQRQDQCAEGWICKAHPFKVLGMRIGHEGKLFESYNPEDFTWKATHHNWEDSCEAHIGGVDFLLQATNLGKEYDITAKGAENWGPVRLLPYRP